MENSHAAQVMIRRPDIPGKFAATLSFGLSIGLTLQQYAYGQGCATISVKQSSSSLGGTVRAGVSDEILDKVSVAVCDKAFHECSVTTSTDKFGRFSIASRKNQKIYYLRFSLYGMDPEQVVVTMKRGAGPLDIKMIVAT
jgi:hypothetical protein